MFKNAFCWAAGQMQGAVGGHLAGGAGLSLLHKTLLLLGLVLRLVLEQQLIERLRLVLVQRLRELVERCTQ